MSKSILGKIDIKPLAELISGGETGVIDVPLKDLHEFKNHPFRVNDDNEMDNLVASIKCHGVLTPGIARPRKEGGFELLAGHRRKRACELAGLTMMPVVIYDVDDDEAVIQMVDANIQREDILPSERAKAFRMKYDALKHRGKTLENQKSGKTVDMIGESTGLSGKKVQRYIFLSNLLEELLDLVDQRKIPFCAGVEISFLPEDEQMWIYKHLEMYGDKLTVEQAKKLREWSGKKCLTLRILE